MLGVEDVKNWDEKVTGKIERVLYSKAKRRQ
jgi:hypothetical protein